MQSLQRAGGEGGDDARVSSTKLQATNPYSRGAGLSKIGSSNADARASAGAWNSSVAGGSSRLPPHGITTPSLLPASNGQSKSRIAGAAAVGASVAAVSICSKKTAVLRVSAATSGTAATAEEGFVGEGSRGRDVVNMADTVLGREVSASSIGSGSGIREVSVKTGHAAAPLGYSNGRSSGGGGCNISSARDSDYTPALPSHRLRGVGAGGSAGAGVAGRYSSISVEDSPLLASPSYPYPYSALAYDRDEGEGGGVEKKVWKEGDVEVWECLACRKENTEPAYCARCSVVRGVTGRKGAEVGIVRR